MPFITVDAKGLEDKPVTRMNRSMEAIREHFLAGEYSHWMNIESDVIPQPDVIEVLLRWGRNSDWISHGYPAAGQHVLREQGIGCSLLSRRLIENFGWERAGANDLPDNWLWSQVRPQAASFPTMELWGYLHVRHL